MILTLTKRNITVLLVTIILSVVLCTLGFDPTTVPPDGVATLWPGAITQAFATILFGAWGIVATVLSGMIVDIVNVGDPYIIFGFMIPDFIQAFIPAFYYRRLIEKDGFSDKVFSFEPFLIYAVLLPNILGGVIATLILYSRIETPLYHSYFRWVFANIPIAILLGYPLLKVMGPVLAEEGYVVKGWWK